MNNIRSCSVKTYFLGVVITNMFIFISVMYSVNFKHNRAEEVEYATKAPLVTTQNLMETDFQVPAVSEVPLLTLFSTWKPGMESRFVYNNTLHIWAKFVPKVTLVFFGKKEDINAQAEHLGWHFLPVTRAHCGGTPVLRKMFTDVYENFNSKFYGYANGDLLFDKGIIGTMEAIQETSFFKQNKNVLISGRRIDFHFNSNHDNVKSLNENVGEFSLRGTISYGYAADFFITTKTYPWHKIPDVVIGRPQYDNYLLYMSRQLDVHIIDATMTIVAIHQRTKERQKSKDECNEKILRAEKKYNRKFIKRGHLDCAKYESRYNKKGEILIIKRGSFTTMC